MFSIDFSKKNPNYIDDNEFGFFYIKEIQSLKRSFKWFDEKPIYFTFNECVFKATSSLFDFKNKEFSEEEIISFINTGQQTQSHKTVYSGIFKIPGGADITVCSLGVTFFYPPITLMTPFSKDLKKTISESIALKTANFTKIASQVSGGLDSTGISSLLKVNHPEKEVLYCSIDTGVTSQNERPYQVDFENKYTL